MFHPHTELRFVSEAIGLGVFATRLIPAGTITWVQDALDQVINPASVPSLPALLRHNIDKYSFTDRRGKLILCWDHARFVNHSCDANCLTPGGADFEIAIRDIQPGDELTDDYGALNLDYPFHCLCNSATCRNEVRPHDALKLSDWWDARVAAVMAHVAQVEQPLWELLRDPETVKAVSLGREPAHSTRMNIAPKLQVAKAG